MIHYRDRSFCVDSFRCGNKACFRWFDSATDTRGLPVAYANFKSRECGYQPITTDARAEVKP